MRDLGANPIPHLNTDSTTALRGAAPTSRAGAVGCADRGAENGRHHRNWCADV